MRVFIQSNPLWAVFVFLALQLSSAAAFSHRAFDMNLYSNGACLYVNGSSKDTSLRFEFSGVRQPTALVVFQYDDIIAFRNLPNLNYFLNHSYILDKPILGFDDETDQLGFLLISRKDFDIPESILATLVLSDKEVDYPIENDGVYCIYMPLYKYNETLVLPQAHYNARVTVKNETMPVNIYHDISTHISLSIVFGLGLVLMSLFHPAIGQGKLTQLPIVTRYIIYFFIVNFVYNSLYFILELICTYFPNDALYDFTENFYFRLQTGVIDKFQLYILILVYLGYGYAGADVKINTKLTTTFWLANTVSRIVTDYIYTDVNTLIDITLLEEKYLILYNSVILPGGYKKSLIRSMDPRGKGIVSTFSLIQVVSESLFYIAITYYAFKINKYWKTKGETQMKKYIYKSIIFHLFIYKFALKYVALQISTITFGGFFDVGELLKVLGNLIEIYEMKVISLNVIEVFILWLIWGVNKPLKPDGTKKKEKEKK